MVQVAGNDEQDGGERAEGARFAGGEVRAGLATLEADLEGGPGEQGEALATAGVVPEHKAVVERATGVVFKLEILEAKLVGDNGLDDLRVGHNWKCKRRAGGRGVGGFVVVCYSIYWGGG